MIPEPLFSLGKVVATPGALAALVANETCPSALIARHLTGDWGTLDEEDILANNDAVANGERILSAYHLADNTKLYVITEWDRSATTILRPEEY